MRTATGALSRVQHPLAAICSLVWASNAARMVPGYTARALSTLSDPHFFTSNPIPIPEFGYLPIPIQVLCLVCFIIIIVDFLS